MKNNKESSQVRLSERMIESQIQNNSTLFNKNELTFKNHQKQMKSLPNKNKNANISQIRKDFAQKIKQLQKQNQQKIIQISQDCEKQKEVFRHVIRQKDEYIKMLEDIVKERQLQTRYHHQTKPQSLANSRHQQYTRHQIPLIDDLSSKINFKISSNNNSKSHEKHMGEQIGHQRHKSIISSFSNYLLGNRDGSKHKLIPKNKPQKSGFHYLTFNMEQAPPQKFQRRIL